MTKPRRKLRRRTSGIASVPARTISGNTVSRLPEIGDTMAPAAPRTVSPTNSTIARSACATARASAPKCSKNECRRRRGPHVAGW